MRAWSADRELELACKVGSMSDFRRALAEGANVDADGGSPLFVAIMKGNREMVWQLLNAGANPAFFLRKSRLSKLKTRELILEALMEGLRLPWWIWVHRPAWTTKIRFLPLKSNLPKFPAWKGRRASRWKPGCPLGQEVGCCWLYGSGYYALS